MKCFLLAAGLGTRLRPITNTIPKCLLPIGGKPLLEIWLDHLGKHGVDQVLINTHWLNEKVESFSRSREDRKPKIILHHEPKLLGSAGTLWMNRNWIKEKETFFIIYGDTLTNVDLSKMLVFHNQHDMLFTLGVFRTDTPSQCGIVEILNDGTVASFVEKPEKPVSNIAAAGVYVADEKLFELFPKTNPDAERNFSRSFDLGTDVIPRLVGMMKAYFIDEFLIDIGTHEAYEKAQKMWKYNCC